LNFIGATLGISILIVIMIILKSFMSNNQIILFITLNLLCFMIKNNTNC
jgi:hypothetical protein